MKIIDDPWFVAGVIISCGMLYFALSDWEAFGAEPKAPQIQQYVPPKAGDFPSIMPNKIHQQRAWTPERSLVYHFFECGDYDNPAWSILMRKNGHFIIASPEAAKIVSAHFVSMVYKELPIRLYDYEPC
ncbi:MAG: hypothetical protein KAJ73_00475 [Zetaproteobacteria bacterium]|nr:hypothetical protein [Zetaproteobacteria bacterium]